MISLLVAFLQSSGTAGVLEPADLQAVYAVGSAEEDPGVFCPVNPLPYTPQSPPQDFAAARFCMQPFVIDRGGFGTASFKLEVETFGGAGDLLSVYDTQGNLIALPAKFRPGQLPDTLLVNGLASGTAMLVLRWNDDQGHRGADRVILRIGAMPDFAGFPLTEFPYFRFPKAINRTADMHSAIDPVRHADRLGMPYDLHVVVHKSPQEWAADPTLEDVTNSGPESAQVTGTSVQDNILNIWDRLLDGNAGAGLGVGYDMVLDFGQDGRLDPGDLIDGLAFGEAGIYIVRNLLQTGPHQVSSFEFNTPGLFHTEGFDGGSTRAMASRGVVVHPDPLPAGKLPLVTFSHGNTNIGTSYRGYRYLQDFLASYGFITASFDMFPAHVSLGIRWRAWLTNKNTERLILQTALEDHDGNPYPSMGGGVLDGKVDGDRIVTVGHSRGGEGVIMQYSQLAHPGITGLRPPGGTLQGFDADSILGVVPISQVTFHTVQEGSTTDDKPFFMFFGGADNDVCGCAASVLPTVHYNRSTGRKMMCYLFGAGHGFFNEQWSCVCTGPDLMTRAQVEQITTAYLFSFVQMVTDDNVPASDFFTLGPNVFRTTGLAFVPEDRPFVTMYRDAIAAGNHVIEDYEVNPDPFLSSSNQPVSFNVQNLFEGWLRDANPTGGWAPGEPNGGFWWETTGAIFDYAGTSFEYEQTIDPLERDLTDDRYLSFLCCQQADHPETEAWNNDIEFKVTLVDALGGESSISIADYGPVEKPHLRAGGWGASYKTIRLRIADFETDGAGVDLGNVAKVRIELGSDHGALRGRLGFDDFEIIRK